MICIHHNKDMDGYTSGAIVKYKYPDCTLIGWDYKDPLPDFEQFKGQDVIMIDISFPIAKLKELGKICNHLTVIDHHISFLKDFVTEFPTTAFGTINSLVTKGWGILTEFNFTYVYEANKAACEIGWEYLFPNEAVPYAVTLIGRYDTWRQNEGNWEEETLPFKYYMYGNCNSTESFPVWLFEKDLEEKFLTYEAVTSGREIMRYQETMDESIASKNYFVMEDVFGGLTAICLNYYPFSSETLKSIWNPELYDIMVGFCYVGNNKWSVSLRSVGDKVDCSVIAKSKGGGGHRNAAGYETESFSKIFI